MKTEEELKKQIEKLKSAENKDFIEVKNFRIYKWNKPIKDFVYPEGFRMAEHSEFVKLYDDGFELEKYPVEYFVKHYSKKQQKTKWCVSWLFLGRGLGLYSGLENLAYSDDNGQVVVVRCKK